MHHNQLQIPATADEHLLGVLRRSPIIASEGTDMYELCDLVVSEYGLMRKNHCPFALGAYQFTTTLAGRNILI